MKHIRLYLIAVALVYSCSLSAQTSLGEQVKQARLKMLAATVSFLTNDRALTKTVATCNNCQSIKAINKFITDNKLKKADSLIVFNQLDLIEISCSVH